MILGRRAFPGVLFASLLIGCSGGVGASLTPIPGGFPSDQRTPNAVQVRLSQSALAKVTADPTNLIESVLGSTDLGVASSCGTDSVCCPDGGPQAPCGPIALDLNLQGGDAPRLAIAPQNGASTLDVTLRARAKTVSPIPFTLSGASCELTIDTTVGASQDVRFDFPLQLVSDPTTGTTRAVPGDLTVSGLTTDDFAVQGGFLCLNLNPGLTFAADVIAQAFADQLAAGLAERTCKRCESGSLDTCGPSATACSDDGLCMNGDQCLPDLGPDGRLQGFGLLTGAVPRSTGSIDLYQVAGGYATTDANGIALGVLGGILPAGGEKERCGPPAEPPAPVSIPQSTYFQGNTDPSSGAPFDLALGIHVSQLDQLAYAAYEGGALCLDVDSAGVPELTTGLLAPSLPSLRALAPDAVPLRIGFRPQAPPTLTLGQDPLLAAHFDRAELDVVATVEEQPVRLFTVVADVEVPVSLEGGMGQITPSVGDLSDALSNLSVKNVQGLTETPEAIAEAFQQNLEVFLGGFTQLGSFPLPRISGLEVGVSSIASVDGDQFLAIEADLFPSPEGQAIPDGGTPAGLAPASGGFLPLPPPSPHAVRGPRPPGGSPGHGGAALLALLCFGAALLLGRKRFRRVARAAAVLLVAFQLQGCSCGGGGGADAGIHAGSDSGVDAGVDAGTDAGSEVDGGTDGGTSSPCGDAGCLPGEVTRGPLGRYNAVASDGQRTLVTTYDEGLGDLVVIDVADGGARAYRAVAGVPEETPTYDPATYRGGVSTPGPDVGAWSSVALAGGLGRVAYQNRDTGALEIAVETTGGWSHHVVDSPQAPQTEVGVEASIVIDGAGLPAVAYLAVGEGAPTELRLARASAASPEASSAWTVQTLATVAEGPKRMWPTLLTLSDGRLALVYADPIRGSPILLLQTAPGASGFEETVLDPGPQRGRWASAVTDGTTIHVAYQDAAHRELYYVSWSGAAGTPEPVDDGVREGDRPHDVGASAAIFLDHGRPAIAYQDALTADLELAVQDGGGWTRTTPAGGAPLDGFHVAAASTGGWLVWRQLEAGRTPMGELVIQPAP